MARNQVIISITSQTKGLQSGLAKATSGLSKLGKVAGAVALAGGVALGAMGVEAFKAVAEIERLNAQTAAAIKSTGGAAQRSLKQLNAQSDALERLTGTEAEVIQGAQNMLLTFTQIKGDNFDKATAAALDLSVALGQDMKSSSVLVGKALNDPIKGIGALSRVGVQLTEDQKNLVKQMMKTGDVAGAQGVILGVLNEQFGGSAKAFGSTFLGAVEKVKNSFGTLTESFVVGLLPVFTDGLNRLNDLFLKIADSGAIDATIVAVGKLIDKAPGFLDLVTSVSPVAILFQALAPIAGQLAQALSGVVDVVKAFLPQLKSLAQTFGTALLQAATALANLLSTVLIPAFISITKWISQNADLVSALAVAIGVGVVAFKAWGAAILVWQGITKAAAAVQAAFNLVMNANPIMLVVTAVSALVAGLIYFFTQTETGKEIWANFTKFIGEAWENVSKWVSDVANNVVKFFSDAWNNITKTIQSVWKGIQNFINGALKFVTNLFLNWTVFGVIVKNWDKILFFFRNLPTIIKGIFNAAVTWLVKAGANIVSGLFNGVKNLWTSVSTWFRNLPNTIRNFFAGVGSWLLSTGRNLIQGLANGISGMAKAVLNSIGNVINGAIDWAKGLLGIKSPSRVFMAIGKYVGEGFVNGVKGTSDKVKSTMSSLADKVISGFDKVADERAKSVKKLADLNKKLADNQRAFNEANFFKGKRSDYENSKVFGNIRRQRKELLAQINEQKAAIKSADKFIGGGKREKALLATINSTNKLLQANAVAREKVAEKLKNAQKQLDDLRNARADVIADITKQTMALGNITSAATAGDMVADLRKQVEATKAFRATLAELQKLGLDNTSRDQLLSKFLQDGSTASATALLAGGASAIKDVAQLQAQLAEQGKALGTTIGDQMYGAGIRSAEGLAKGLQSEAKNLEKVADNLAKRLVSTVKKTLGIKSPSRVFAGLGKYLVQGLAGGIDKTRDVAVKSVDKLSTAVVNGFNADLATPTLTGPNGGSVQGPAPVYNVYVNTLNATAETGRVIVESIKRYDANGGRA
ncbi:phage tail protein [Microbacterium oleivorans]|uniref:Tape measure protein n=1 Tax=Microbacterium oleivorans TaxID=273677 RepID=A0A4R5YER2_9MICO|nr:hypothetical protein [Microbacterium oleivorans]TDL43602.1 hypothetical protein E2R54_10335 [Microbacterium oleivorans]